MEQIVTHLTGTYRNFKTFKTKITIDGVDYNGPGFIRLLSTMPEMKPHLEPILLQTDAERLTWCREVWARIDEFKRQERQEQNQQEFTARLATQFALYSDWKTGRKVVYDRLNHRMSDMHPDTFIDNLNAWQKKLLREEGINPCMEVFDPYRLQNFWTDSTLAVGQEVIVLNSYLPPDWRTVDGVNYKDESGYKNGKRAIGLPTQMEAFFVHLFPDEQQRRIS